MNLSTLIEEALEERGNALMVIDAPADGEDAVIRIANAPLALILGRRVEALTGSTVGMLAPLVEDTEDWASLLKALRTQTPLRLDLRLRVDGRELWFGFDLTFKAGRAEAAGAAAPSHGIMIGRDITQSRRRALQANESQRLLASVFMRINAAVAIIGSDGSIMMANPAFHRVLGYEAGAIEGLNAVSMVAPDHAAAARAARARQMLDGANYELPIEMLGKDGSRIKGRMTAALLRDAAVNRLRVVTFLPDPPGEEEPRDRSGMNQAAAPGVKFRSVGQLQAISFEALKAAAGGGWQRIASRAMLMAEQILKRRLGPEDVFSRSDDDGFVIWFENTDEAHNALVLAAAAREIRLRFLTELGDEVAAHVSAAMSREAAEDAAVARDRRARSAASAALLERLDAERQKAIFEVKALVRELQETPVANVKIVIDRDAQVRPLVVVDFAPPYRRRIFDLAACTANGLANELDPKRDVDLLRFDLALRELARRRGKGHVLVSVSWAALTGFARRHAIDDRIDRLEPELRAQLIVVISDVPPTLDAKRWSEMVTSLRRRLGEIGLMITLADGDVASLQETIAGSWPISLLVIDGSDPGSTGPDGYYGLIAAARRRNIGVLVRAAAPEDITDWRELGATLFAGSV